MIDFTNIADIHKQRILEQQQLRDEPLLYVNDPIVECCLTRS